jgi:hypothetical protein
MDFLFLRQLGRKAIRSTRHLATASMKRIGVGLAIGALACAAITGAVRSGTSAASERKPEPAIYIEDVERFYKIYDSADGHPTGDRIQRQYIDPGSDGLHQFANLRNISGATIAEALAKSPEIYSNAKGCIDVLPSVRLRLHGAFRKLGNLYPQAKFLPVTIAVGRGKPVAMTGPAGVFIGLEALCATDYLNPDLEERFVHVIAHEYTHVQQVPALVDNKNPSVLEASLIEGAAEFTAELISGQVAYSQAREQIKKRGTEIETAFVSDEDKTDLSKWLYNGTLKSPGDLGYWVGYRIVRAYYQHAADKRQAFREILEMTDPKAFLAKSGWYPGIRLK